MSAKVGERVTVVQHALQIIMSTSRQAASETLNLCINENEAEKLLI